LSSSLGKDSRIEIDDLCAAAEERARGLGHRLGAWEDRSEGSVTAWRATCSTCAAVAYVRIAGGLLGAAGEACTEPCARRH
jgi:hypothetical protein